MPRRVAIRELHPHDRDALRAFFLALNEDDRYRRFGRAMSHDALIAYVERIDFADTHVLAAYDRRADMVGVLELAQLHDGVCEIAVVVGHTKRGSGIGKALMDRALLKAKVLGSPRVVLLCQVDNAAMRRLAKSAGLQSSEADGDVEGHLDLAPAALSEVTEDATREAVGNATYASLLATRTWAELFERALQVTRCLVPQR